MNKRTQGYGAFDATVRPQFIAALIVALIFAFAVVAA